MPVNGSVESPTEEERVEKMEHKKKGGLQSTIGVIESVAPIHWLED